MRVGSNTFGNPFILRLCRLLKKCQHDFSTLKIIHFFLLRIRIKEHYCSKIPREPDITVQKFHGCQTPLVFILIQALLIYVDDGVTSDPHDFNLEPTARQKRPKFVFVLFIPNPFKEPASMIAKS